MDHSELAVREHENWIDYLSASVSRSPDGIVIREGGVVALLGHVPMRFYNQILVEDLTASASAVAGAVARARARRDPFAVSLREGTDDRFRQLMDELGLEELASAATLAMAMHPVADPSHSGATEPTFEVRRVTDDRGLSNHRRVATAGFEADPSVAEAMIGADLLHRPECSIYVGYLDDQPVSAGLGWMTGRTIGVYNIATVPAARRRGFGQAMTARVLADGRAAGCDVAVLQASGMGQPIYVRMGFRPVLRYVGWVESMPGGASAGPP